MTLPGREQSTEVGAGEPEGEPAWRAVLVKSLLRANVLAHAVGLLVSSATLGSALLPALVGFIVARLGFEAIAAAALAMGVLFALLHEVCVSLPDAATPAEPGARPLPG